MLPKKFQTFPSLKFWIFLLSVLKLFKKFWDFFGVFKVKIDANLRSRCIDLVFIILAKLFKNLGYVTIFAFTICFHCKDRKTILHGLTGDTNHFLFFLLLLNVILCIILSDHDLFLYYLRLFPLHVYKLSNIKFCDSYLNNIC